MKKFNTKTVLQYKEYLKYVYLIVNKYRILNKNFF